jgi:hypothetical protein
MNIIANNSAHMGKMKTIIDQIENHKFKVFLFVSISMLMIYGLILQFYIAYNLDYYTMLIHSDIFLNEHLPMVHGLNNHEIVLRWFFKIFRWFLQIPALFILSSVFVQIIILWLIFKIADFFLDDPFLAFVSSLYFVLAGNYNSHGVVLNGIWDGPTFYHTSMSSIFILSGIYLALKERLIAGSIFFVFSLYFHVLQSIAGLAFFLPGCLYYLIFKKNLKIKQLIIPGTIIFLNLSFIVSGQVYVQNELPYLQSSLSQWYTHCYSMDVEDMSLFYTFGNHGYALSLLIALALYIAIKFKQTDSFTALRNLFFWGIPVLFVALIIESAHRYGFFMGKLSEFFIIAGLRRGLWVLMFFSILLILKQIDFYLIEKDMNGGISDLKKWILVASFLTVYLLSDWLFVGCLCTLFIIFKPTWKSVLLIIVFLLLMVPFSFWAEFEITSRMLQIAVFYCVCILAFICIYNWVGMGKRLLLLFPLVVFIICGVLAGLYQQKLQSNIKLISQEGFFSLPNYQFLDSKKDKKIYKILRQNNPDHLPVLRLVKSLDYNDLFIYGARSFISLKDYRWSVYSKRVFENLLYKAKELGVINSAEDFHPGGDRFYSKQAVADFLDVGIKKLDTKKLEYLNKKYNIGFLLTETQYSDFKLLFEQNGTYLYALF